MTPAKIWEALNRALTKASHHSKATSKPSPITDTKTEDLLAFNTITTMLSYFWAPNNRLATNTPIGINDTDRRILKVLDAVSAVLIRDNEVTAVVAKPYERSNFQVFASVTYIGNAESLLQSTPIPSQSSFWDRFIVGVNPRDDKINGHTDSLMNSSLLPILGDHKDRVPQNLIDLAQQKSDRVLHTFLETCWGKEPFDTHAWMLKTLLRPSEEKFPPFFLYVIAASFPKMIRRTTKRLSATYMASLLEQKTFAFIETAQKSGNSQSDPERDQPFVRAMSGFVSVARTKIPNLERAAKQQQPAVEIYNKDTYMEFHFLLCEILTSFCASLMELQSVKKDVAVKFDLKKSLTALKKVMIFGTYLKIMVRSSAIETHLQSIAHLLVVDARKLWTPSEAGAEEDTDIADFQCLKPYSMRKGKPLLPWQSYRDWLQLMVHYFDSATILDSFIKELGSSFTPDTFSITILTPPGPSPDKEMLSWTKLLKTEYFAQTPPGEMSGKGFIKVLGDICKTYAPMRNPIKLLASRAAKGLQSDASACVSEIRTSAERMVDKYTLPDQHKIIAKIIELTEKRDMESIVEGLNILLKSASFYMDLQQGSLYQGKGFKGRHHCEAYLASLLAVLVDQSGTYVADFEKRLGTLFGQEEVNQGCELAIGVSKRCCPVCAFLLHLLNIHCGTKFVVSDEHSNISACSLPEWLPGNIVRLMVEEFSRRLREELNKLTANNNLRGRVGTSDTARISIDSLRSEFEPTFDEVDIEEVLYGSERLL